MSFDMSIIPPTEWGDVAGSGKSMPELGDKWSKGFFGLPEKLNPYVVDDTTDPRGKRGSVERAKIANTLTPDPIFFLGGSPSAVNLPNPVRSAVVSEDDVLVFPIINTIEPDAFDRLPNGTFPDEDTTRKEVNQLLDDNPVSFEVFVDDLENPIIFADTIESLDYRIESPEGGFSYKIPPKTWVIDPDTGERVDPQEVEPAVQAGYWFAYDTGTESFLPDRDHTVQFKGSLPEIPFELTVTYNILNPIIGTNKGEEIPGTEFNDYIVGKNGKDTLTGLGGDDLILGGNGKDIIDGGPGSDELWGDNGKDTFIFKPGYGEDKIFDFKRKEIVELGEFTEVPDITDFELDSGVSAAKIDFQNGSDILYLVGVSASDVNISDSTITL